MILKDKFSVGHSFASIGGEKSHGPGKVSWIVEYGRTRFDEKLRDFSLVHVVADGEIALRSYRTKDQQHFVVFHQLAREVGCLGCFRSVVYADEIDFSTVNPAAIVDHLEIRRLCPRDGGEFVPPTGIWRDIPNLDFSIGRARIIGFL